MKAQVSLTPSESKKLIAKGVIAMDITKEALANGTVVMHPSSSTFFIREELMGQVPDSIAWVAGVIVPKGTCVSENSNRARSHHAHAVPDPGDNKGSWVIRNTELVTGIALRDLLESMGPGDLYIKGVNCLDTQGTVGVLVGNRVERGTIGRVVAASRRKGFTMVFPVGLEKLIPGTVKEAAREAIKTSYDYSMGINCSLLPCKGRVVTEAEAISILSGAVATPIAAGGLDGAEGAITLVVKGSEHEVTTALNYVEQSKGARLPRAGSPTCDQCNLGMCDFPLAGKPWVESR